VSDVQNANLIAADTINSKIWMRQEEFLACSWNSSRFASIGHINKEHDFIKDVGC